MSLRLVLASNNAKKLGELQGLLADLPLTLVGQGSLGIPEAEEPHRSFLENALAKARHAARAAGGAALADDSGLCVEALGGQPGVDSAVYAPLPAGDFADREARRAAQDAANNARLLAAMQGRTDRRAAFVCVLVALRHADDPLPLVATGCWAGELLQAPRGQGGFGYDPLLWIPSEAAAVAELPAARKAALSHRGAAARALVAQLREVWALRP